MNLPILLASCLLLISTDAHNASSHHDDFIEILDTINNIKNLLDEGTPSYEITWDPSLALYAAERVDMCPLEVSEGEMFVKAEDVMKLSLELNSTDSFSLAPLPTIAIFQNRAARIHLDIGSRIGCSFTNCSSGNDLYCVFDNRKHAQDRLSRQICVKSEQFPNLCEEQPIDYWNMEFPEFKWNMMKWNEKRRAVAKKFEVSGMYQLTWSEDAVRFAILLGSQCDPNHAGFLGTHFHMHPRALDPLGALWIMTHDELDGSKVFGNSTIEMFAPQRKEFGCVPIDPEACKDYSYICVLGPDWSSSSPITIPTGKLCEECPGKCDDGLCQGIMEFKETPTTLNSTTLPELTTPENMLLENTWKMLALLVCFIGAVGAAMLLLYIVVTDEYHF